jgi:hypothetical protein
LICANLFLLFFIEECKIKIKYKTIPITKKQYIKKNKTDKYFIISFANNGARAGGG